MSEASGVYATGQMSDLLSAASLLLTVLGIVYGSWYPEITAALAVAVPDNMDNRGPVRRVVRTALWGKAFPLALAAITLAILFSPNALVIVVGGLGALGTKGLGAFHEYNSVPAAFCLVVILSCALAVYLASLVYALSQKMRKISTP